MNAQENKLVLVTGGAGFIGSHLVDRLLQAGARVVVLDNFDKLYGQEVKRKNIEAHALNSRFELFEGDIRSASDLSSLFAAHKFDVVVHLAALAGVGASLLNPSAYMEVNVVGTQRLIDAMIKQPKPPHLVFGSSSSVYGERSSAQSFSEDDRVDRPLSPYAASKIGAEGLCFAAHHALDLNVVCLRFFTVYGPRQRPDLAIYKFCQAIDSGRPVEMFGDGTTLRDYTYVEDIVTGVVAATELTACGFEIINLGRSEPVELRKVIHHIETALGKEAEIVINPIPPGDVPNTFANIEKAHRLLNYVPKTSIQDGITNFVNWYRQEKMAKQSENLDPAS